MRERSSYDESVTTTSQRLLALRSPEPLHRLWAAEDLATVAEPEVTAALTEALTRTLQGPSLDEGAARGFVSALVAALGGREDEDAVAAIVAALRATLGDDVVPAAACAALAKSRARSALPALQDVFRHEDAEPHADELAGAIVAIGQAEAIPFLRGALDLDDSRAGAAAEALGQLGDSAAVLRIEALATHTDRNIAIPAIVAAIRLGAPRAGALAVAALEGDHSGDKMVLIEALRRSGRGELGPVLRARAADCAQDDGELRATLLEAAACLGDASAKEDLRTAVESPAESPCAQGWAALALCRLGDARAVRFFVDYLRRNRGHADADSRDAYVQRVVVQQQMISALEEHARRDPAAHLDICDLLHAIRQEASGLLPYARSAAQSAIQRLTQTERFSEYRAWREQHT